MPEVPAPETRSDRASAEADASENLRAGEEDADEERVDEPSDPSTTESEESFENSAPASIDQLRDSPEEEGRSYPNDEASAGQKPELDELVAKIPESNRRTVEELFRGRFTTVRRLDRKKLY